MPKFRAPRGTHDVLPNEIPEWRFVEEMFRDICARYGYREIRTPIFEQTDLFVRTVGETSEIVMKQMYTFTDPGGERWTLRPEGTAPVVRAFIQHSLDYGMPLVKLFYIAPIFRYERPQAGRYRQHHQAGIEALGASDPTLDAEIIALGVDFLTAIGIEGYEIHMNSVGCPHCRPSYRTALINFLTPHAQRLCPDCQRRLHANPLRILDCKNDACKALTENAPPIVDYLCDECASHYAQVLQTLEHLGIACVQDHRLVRGLDYYTKTTFEFLHGELGAQNAILGGGRYDGLIEECGGKPTPGIGFGCGLERLLIVRQQLGKHIAQEAIVDVFVCTVGAEVRNTALRVLYDLRRAGIRADMDYLGRSLKAQMRFADKLGATYAVIIGSDELKQGMITVRSMDKSEQDQVPLNEVVDYLLERR